MMPKNKTADASFYYHDSTASDIARMDSSAVCGNLADAMKNGTVLMPNTHVVETIPLDEEPESDK